LKIFDVTLEIKNLLQPIDRYCSNVERLIYLEKKIISWSYVLFEMESKICLGNIFFGKIPPV